MMILQSASIEQITQDIFKTTLQDETTASKHKMATTTLNAIPSPALLRFDNTVGGDLHQNIWMQK